MWMEATHKTSSYGLSTETHKILQWIRTNLSHLLGINAHIVPTIAWGVCVCVHMEEVGGGVLHGSIFHTADRCS